MTTKAEVAKRAVNFFVGFTGVVAFVRYLFEFGLTVELGSLLGAGMLATGLWLAIDWWGRRRGGRSQGESGTTDTVADSV